MTIAGWFRVLRMFRGLVGRLPPGHLWYLFRRMRNEKPHRFNGQLRINTFFPPYPSRAFDRFCRAVVERRRVPFSTYLAVTHDCPYHCEHCSSTSRANTELSRAQLLDVVAQTKALGTCTLGLTGGEPLLREDLADVIAAAGPEMATILFTTGKGLDDQRARRFAQAGLTCATIGIEADNATMHDAVRAGPGSFEQARQAARAFRQAGIYTALSTVATHQRLAAGQLERMYELARRWGAGEFRVLAPVATGRQAGHPEFMLSPQEYRRLAEMHVRYNRRSGGPAVACFAYLESAEMFGCGAGYHHLYIDAAGNVCPCDLTPASFGNVTEEPLAEIWGRMARHFSLPRCGCLMKDLAGRIHGPDLPLGRERSEAICPVRLERDALPEIYRRLFKR